ncbi:hypothetical protein KsCSTR_41040 [Candidatus Kuenenia stuttgartiensis]|uniref:Uncharacterized protein n=1 Tax=Kuenenia stuttgartiensis TaxID=174633 RepID=Q1Q7H5_KUEST|nr:hypothetical protein KsCSTR_41040 [Candidatus Kuenenia stuttgartiensis]CAJ70767.1 unknown protein [Candidatus Kuenenia stuttgartiensis]
MCETFSPVILKKFTKCDFRNAITIYVNKSKSNLEISICEPLQYLYGAKLLMLKYIRNKHHCRSKV